MEYNYSLYSVLHKMLTLMMKKKNLKIKVILDEFL